MSPTLTSWWYKHHLHKKLCEKQIHDTVQLKGNLTHADRAHATYGLKACSYHQPILACAVRKTCQHYFCKRQECRLRGHYSGYSRGYIYTFPSVIMYINIRSHLVFSSFYTLCNCSLYYYTLLRYWYIKKSSFLLAFLAEH